MPSLLPHLEPDGLLEYSVVYTDRAYNHMSQTFQGAMRELSALLKEVYQAHSVAIVPGNGTGGMEAVARQFATGKKCLVIRNGWFSFRWTQILDMGAIASASTVIKARRVDATHQSAFAPAPIAEVVAAIKEQKPDLIFAPHIETSLGMQLPDAYLKAVAEAAHDVGALFVLDCIASGALWVDMAATGVDVLISAPQKSWSSAPGCALVMLGEAAREQIEHTTSTSFALDLKKWLHIMEAYEGGSFAYHATMPTNALVSLRDTMKETQGHGFAALKHAQQTLGAQVRAAMERRGYKSAAAVGFQAPCVIVSYTDDMDTHNGKRFIAQGLQIAPGVPLQCDEPADFRTFRLGLFGLDKLLNVERTVKTLEDALDRI